MTATERPSDLLPCPFCGGTARPTAHLECSWFAPACKACGVRGPTVRIERGSDPQKLRELMSEADRLWNTRTLDAAPADPVVSAECWRSALARAVHICDQEAAEWDSDAVVTDKNYAATCASRIRELAREGK
jgi:hypothetical protein